MRPPAEFVALWSPPAPGAPQTPRETINSPELSQSLCRRLGAGQVARADGLLTLGIFLDREKHLPAAAEIYRCRLSLRCRAPEVRYFLSNNLGFCLNELGKYREAEGYCRIALEIDPSRHNAHKNLGVALEGLGRHAEALAYYLSATELFPADPRALQLARGLLTRFPFLVEAAGPEVAEKARRLGATGDGSVN